MHLPSPRFPLSLLLVLALLLPAAPAWSLERIGVAVDGFLGSGRLDGEQWINATRLDESFDYSDLGLSGTVWLLMRHPKYERFRFGPGVRAYGIYGSVGNQPFRFGPLFEGFVNAEYSLRAIEKFDALFGLRGGFGLLFPGGELAQEIDRLQREGVSVWSLPRVGWLLGADVGTRRRMSKHLWLRLDVNAQYQQLFLFATTEEISGLRFRKNWASGGLRFGLSLGVELAL